MYVSRDKYTIITMSGFAQCHSIRVETKHSSNFCYGEICRKNKDSGSLSGPSQPQITETVNFCLFVHTQTGV